jgi:hypothetical protein
MKFLRRQAAPAEPPPTAEPVEGELEPEQEMEPPPPPGIAFDGLTEDWRIVGRIVPTAQAADPIDSIARSLNNRDPVELHDTQWASLDEPDALEPAPGLSRMSAYDLVAIVAGDPGEPPMSDGEFAVYQVRKTASPVELELPPFRVRGTHFVEGRAEADHLLRRYGALFVPIADATLHLGDRLLSDPHVQTILVNRLYIKGVRVLDSEWLKTSGIPADSPLARRIASVTVRTVAPAPPEFGKRDSSG